jgi:demethylmenaquinone methyltransferase/2-methoxy-6-polyprenyl-1,4-benzoquinol methylase
VRDDARRTVPHPVLREYYARESERRGFVTALFEGSAKYYDRAGAVLAFGSGALYRRQSLDRAGLRPGMTLLDVATGTGQVARAALSILGDSHAVVGLDPSAGMLAEARRGLPIVLVRGTAEALPFAAERFDFLSMGFALRHVGDLEIAFAECLRVLKPGGRVLLLEVTRPRSAAVRTLVRLYVRRVVPLILRLTTRSSQPGLLMKYYWDTIAECVPAETILDVMRDAGFVEVDRKLSGGILSEYVGSKPARPAAVSASAAR